MEGFTSHRGGNLVDGLLPATSFGKRRFIFGRAWCVYICFLSRVGSPDIFMIWKITDGLSMCIMMFLFACVDVRFAPAQCSAIMSRQFAFLGFG